MWEVTEDPYWLAKIRDHFNCIVQHASDPDADGYLTWKTKEYSCAVAYAERLLNVSDAQINPNTQKNSDGRAAARCSGHTYLIEFPSGPDRFRIVDRGARRVVADGLLYREGVTIAQIEPFRFTLTGRPHQGDRFLVRTIGPEALPYTVHQGMFAYPVAEFVEAVKKRPEFRTRFGADADRFLAFILKNLFEKNERDWLDLGDTGGYRFQPQLTDRFPNRIMPHNQYAALARAWLVLKDLDCVPALVGRRAEQMARLFHRSLELDSKRDAYRWYYWDWIEFGKPAHSGYEDTSHASINVSLAVEAARRQVVFQDQDLRRIANTWLRVMCNGDDKSPRMSAFVDGQGVHRFSPLSSRWTELSQWDRKVYDLALAAFLSLPSRQRARSIPTMLLCAKRAGVLPGRR